ncbi:hypothetical protein NL676_028818 [Syzygium grande]|nr:hypothetical protein NL676_028818 [Syzygium grande]
MPDLAWYARQKALRIANGEGAQLLLGRISTKSCFHARYFPEEVKETSNALHTRKVPRSFRMSIVDAKELKRSVHVRTRASGRRVKSLFLPIGVITTENSDGDQFTREIEALLNARPRERGEPMRVVIEDGNNICRDDTEVCKACDKTVHLVDQLTADNEFFHKA